MHKRLMTVPFSKGAQLCPLNSKVSDKILLLEYQKELSKNTQESSKYPGIIEKECGTSDFTIRFAFLLYYLNDLFQLGSVSLYYCPFLSFLNNFCFYFLICSGSPKRKAD